MTRSVVRLLIFCIKLHRAGTQRGAVEIRDSLNRQTNNYLGQIFFIILLIRIYLFFKNIIACFD